MGSVMVLRAWVDDSTGRLTVRMIDRSSQPAEGAAGPKLAGSADEVCAHINDWLVALQARGRP